uniref:Uncharacterized protein n=1 Tax=Nelumbo nucifera TaxID=4432 RepID=A0A822ZKH5_NELNU|nr:TPA_asm: hypothetical protein HUJ06_003892 [Nelumbo nucifera]
MLCDKRWLDAYCLSVLFTKVNNAMLLSIILPKSRPSHSDWTVTSFSFLRKGKV